MVEVFGDRAKLTTELHFISSCYRVVRNLQTVLKKIRSYAVEALFNWFYSNI